MVIASTQDEARGTGRIHDALSAARRAQRPALVSYLTGGFPDPVAFGQHLEAVSRVADVVEVGIPFSDPMADGLSIQKASEVALAKGTTPEALLRQLATLELSAPVVIMSYLNPLLRFGRRLGTRLHDAGVSGVIVPDLPFEEGRAFREELSAYGIAPIQLVTPVTPEERLARLAGASRGFIYAVTHTGITGGEVELPRQALDYLGRVRRHARVPVLAGFGIRRAAQVTALAPHCDGVIVGSALVDAIAGGEDPAALLRRLLPG